MNQDKEIKDKIIGKGSREDFNEIIDDSLPLKAKVGYGIANASVGALSGIALGGAITFFYNYKMGLSEGYTSLAWLIFGIWNAINDPLFGFMGDNTRTKIGRRIPYLRYGSPFFGLLFILCWFPWADSQVGLFWNFLIVLILFDTIYTIVGLVVYSLPAEMCVKTETRSNLIIYSIFLGAIGTIISTIVPLFYLTQDKSTSLHPWFRPLMVIIGIVSASAMFWASYKIKENEYTRLEEPLPFFQGIKEAFNNKPFLVFEMGNFSYTLARTLLTTGMYYFTVFVLELDGFMTTVPVILVFGVGILMTLFYSKKIPKYGLKKVFRFGLAWSGIGFIITFFLGRTLVPALILFSVIGTGFSAVLVTSQAIMADIIDFDETHTGKRRETTYYGVNALINKPAISLANAAFLSLINYFGFVRPEEEQVIEQSPRAIVGIMLGIALLPGIFMIFTSLTMKYYSLEGLDWAEKKEEIAEIHLKKEKEYLKYVAELEQEKKKKPS